MVMRVIYGRINGKAIPAVANSDRMAETEVMRINANAPRTILTKQAAGDLLVRLA